MHCSFLSIRMFQEIHPWLWLQISWTSPLEPQTPRITAILDRRSNIPNIIPSHEGTFSVSAPRSNDESLNHCVMSPLHVRNILQEAAHAATRILHSRLLGRALHLHNSLTSGSPSTCGVLPIKLSQPSYSLYGAKMCGNLGKLTMIV